MEKKGQKKGHKKMTDAEASKGNCWKHNSLYIISTRLTLH